MIIPVRCFTCGAVTADKWEIYQELLSQGKTEKMALDELNIQKYCCRRMFLSNVSNIDKLIEYSNLPKDKRITIKQRSQSTFNKTT
jgi:DNA-directed RNA polymerase subunit N (RpoN/RPB10)